MNSPAYSGADVRWRDTDQKSHEWFTLRQAPQDNRGFIEARRYIFEKLNANWSFHIDDERLEDDADEPSCWRWEPRFFAGEVTAELVRPDRSRAALFLLDVSPSPSKIGREFFSQMISELWAADPSLVIGSEPATSQIGDLGTMQDPWLAFARLRRYTPEFFRAVVPIRARPRRALRVRRGSAPLHHARRVDRRTATALLRSPAVALFFAGAEDATAFGADTRLDVPVVEETVDAAANRSMLALVLALLRRARALRDRLQHAVDHESISDTRTSLAARWPARRQFLDDLTAELQVLARQSPFGGVQRSEITATGLTAIAADPVYSRAWGRGWRALRHGVESSESTERLWVSPSWEIYERWCFLRVGQLLSATLPAWSWRRLKSPDRWVGTHAGRHAELRLQPTFRSREREIEKMWSISKERVPDLVLTVHDAEAVRFVVLDAKYRSSRSNVLDAMESAHIYQDSLRIGSRRPEAALLLIPSTGGASWLEEPAFQLEHRVGIHPFSPGSDSALPPLVMSVLDV
jgi:hypothetical protein